MHLLCDIVRNMVGFNIHYVYTVKTAWLKQPKQKQTKKQKKTDRYLSCIFPKNANEDNHSFRLFHAVACVHPSFYSVICTLS